VAISLELSFSGSILLQDKHTILKIRIDIPNSKDETYFIL